METILKLLKENPNLVMPVVKEYIAKYKPTVYELLNEFLDVYKDFSNNTEYFETVARTKWNMFNAYTDAGFNEDQALALMINDNIQLMKNINKTADKTNSSVTIKGR